MAREQLDTKSVAERLGWKPGTVTRYAHPDRRERYGFPAPDGYISDRPWWWESTIDAYKASRPGQGAGGGRPRKDNR